MNTKEVSNLEEIGLVCVYCGTETEEMCCGEVHLEYGYETEDGELILESELNSLTNE